MPVPMSFSEALLTGSTSRRPLRPPPLPCLLSDLQRMLGAGARVKAPLEPAELALELAPAVEALSGQRAAAERLANGAPGLALV